MGRITIVDVRRQFTDRYMVALQGLKGRYYGLDLTLTYTGSCYTLTDKDGFAAPGVVGHGMEAGYIGTTAAEAYATLQTIAKSFEWVINELHAAR
jgi:hypothetical protein